LPIEDKSYLIIENYVVGKRANPNLYFKMRVTIQGNVGDIYNIYGQDAEVLYEGEIINTITCFQVTQDTNYFYIYLKNGQTATIGLSADGKPQIPIGTKYTVEVYNMRKYQTIINDVITKINQDIMNNKYSKIVVVNTTDFDVAITGIIINLLPYILIFVGAIIGTAIFIFLKIKKEKNEDNK
jgi:hypothetical protein